METIEREELRTQVRQAVAGLDEELGQTVRLRYEHALGYAEIAEAMQVPEGTVARRLNTAHERLRKSLAGAGLVVTLALLERELAAEPRIPAPEGLADGLKRVMRESGATEGALHGGRKARTRAMAVVLLSIGALFLVWRLAADRPSGDGAGGVGNSGLTGRDEKAGAPGAEAGKFPSSGIGAGGETEIRSAASRLTGRVVDALSNEPLSGATVVLTRWGGNRQGEINEVLATTDAHGRFSLEAGTGRFLIDAFSEGHVGHHSWLLMRHYEGEEPEERPLSQKFATPIDYAIGMTDRFRLVDMDPAVPATRDVALTPGSEIRGVVYDPAGSAIPGVEVVFSGQDCRLPGSDMKWGFKYPLGPPGAGPTLTDEAGRFRIGALYPGGPVELRLSCAGFAERGLQVPLVGLTTEISITLRASTPVAGEVTDLSGRPIEGAHVYIDDPRGAHANPWHLLTGTTGTFEFENPPGESNFLVAWAPGHGWTGVRLEDLRAGPIRLTLPDAGPAVKGRVRNNHGVPVPGALVVVESIRRRSGPARGVLEFDRGGMHHVEVPADEIRMEAILIIKRPEVLTDANGEFTLEGLETGPEVEVVLRVIQREYQDARGTVGDTHWLDLTLEPEPLDDK